MMPTYHVFYSFAESLTTYTSNKPHISNNKKSIKEKHPNNPMILYKSNTLSPPLEPPSHPPKHTTPSTCTRRYGYQRSTTLGHCSPSPSTSPPTSPAPPLPQRVPRGPAPHDPAAMPGSHACTSAWRRGRPAAPNPAVLLEPGKLGGATYRPWPRGAVKRPGGPWIRAAAGRDVPRVRAPQRSPSTQTLQRLNQPFIVASVIGKTDLGSDRRLLLRSYSRGGAL